MQQYIGRGEHPKFLAHFPLKRGAWLFSVADQSAWQIPGRTAIRVVHEQHPRFAIPYDGAHSYGQFGRAKIDQDESQLSLIMIICQGKARRDQVSYPV